MSGRTQPLVRTEQWTRGRAIYEVSSSAVEDSAMGRFFLDVARWDRWRFPKRAGILAVSYVMATLIPGLLPWPLSGAAGPLTSPMSGNGLMGVFFLLLAFDAWRIATLTACLRNAGILEDLYLSGDRPIVIYAAIVRSCRRSTVTAMLFLVVLPLAVSIVRIGASVVLIPAGMAPNTRILPEAPLVLVATVACVIVCLCLERRARTNVRFMSTESWLFFTGAATTASLAAGLLRSHNLAVLAAGVAFSIFFFVTGLTWLVVATVLMIVVLGLLAVVHSIKARSTAGLTPEQFEELFAAFIAKQDVHAVFASFSK